MQIFKGKIRVEKNGKGGRWKRAVVGIPADIASAWDWEEKDVVVALSPEGEDVDSEEVRDTINKYRKIDAMHEEIMAMKRDLMSGEKDDSMGDAEEEG